MSDLFTSKTTWLYSLCWESSDNSGAFSEGSGSTCKSSGQIFLLKSSRKFFNYFDGNIVISEKVPLTRPNSSMANFCHVAKLDL